MSHERYDEHDDYPDVAALDRICGDALARRELLWIRAIEKDDERAQRSLELVDPGIEGRVSRLDSFGDCERAITHREVQDAYGRLWDECLAHHAERLSPGSSRPRGVEARRL